MGFVFFSATCLMSGRPETIEAFVWFGDLQVMLDAHDLLNQQVISAVTKNYNFRTYVPLFLTIDPRSNVNYIYPA